MAARPEFCSIIPYHRSVVCRTHLRSFLHGEWLLAAEFTVERRMLCEMSHEQMRSSAGETRTVEIARRERLAHLMVQSLDRFE